MQTEARPPKNKSASDPRPARSRARLREAALALIDEGNWHPTVEQIARRASVSKRTFFTLFVSREDFLEELMGDNMGIMSGTLRRQTDLLIDAGVLPTVVRLILTGKGNNNVSR